MEEKQSTLFVLSIAIGLTVVLGRCSPTPISSEAMSAKQPSVTPSAGTAALPLSPGLQTLTGQGTVAVRASADARLLTQVVTLSGPMPTPQQEHPTPLPVALPPGLVYSVADGLWKVGSNGRQAHIFDHSGASLSPDGAQALYVLDDDLWLTDLIAGEQRNLTNTPDRIERCPQWWPARPDLVLCGSWAQDADLGPSTGFLTVVQVDGSGYRILDKESQSNALPAPAPDGRTIAYDRGGTAWLYDWDSGREPFDVEVYGLPESKSTRMGSPAWSPDGRQLAWVVGGGFGDGWRIGIAVFDLEARTSRLLHPYEPMGVGGWPGVPVWSPDGQWLAYPLGHATDPAQSGLWVLRADGQDERLLGDGGNPVWSPDGRWLVFTQHIAEQETAVWLLETGIWEPQLMDLPASAVSVGWTSTFAHSPSSVLPEPTLIRYSNPTLGFAVDYPYDWEVTGPMNQVDPLARSWSVIEFASNLYGYGHQAFGKYAVTVAVGQSMGRTLTETVAYSLSPIVPQFREGIKSDCCLAVGGEPAMEVLGFPLTRWGSRQIVVIHDGREYRLTFYPQRTLDGVTSSDATARAAFDAFLRTFTFIPVTATPILPTPTITPVPTPTPMIGLTVSPTPVGHPTPAVAPGTTVDVDCADVVPFAPGCLDQRRPPSLALDIAFVGILPAGPVQVAAWSTDSTHLAYTVVNPETSAFQGLEVRSLPDFRLEGRWSVPAIFDLTWTLDGQAVLFVFDRGDTSSIGLARLGEPDWRDLLPGRLYWL